MVQEKRDRLRLAPFNPDLHDAARRARLLLGLPEDGLPCEVAEAWRHHHRYGWVWRVWQELKPPVRFRGFWSLPFPVPPFDLDLQLEERLPENQRSLWYGIIQRFFELNPLRKCAVALRDAFGLPLLTELLPTIEAFIITGDPDTLISRYLKESGHLMVIDIPTRDTTMPITLDRDYSISIFGLDRFTTQKEWNALWKEVRAKLDARLGKVTGKRRKDPLDEDLEWWRAHRAGETVAQIMNEWNQTHPPKPQRRRNPAKAPKERAVEDESTIYRAIKRIEDLMRPLFPPPF